MFRLHDRLIRDKFDSNGVDCIVQHPAGAAHVLTLVAVVHASSTRQRGRVKAASKKVASQREQLSVTS